MFDFERCRDALTVGRLVLEGRSVHSTAVYQSLIVTDDDEAAHDLAHTHFSRWPINGVPRRTWQSLSTTTSTSLLGAPNTATTAPAQANSDASISVPLAYTCD